MDREMLGLILNSVMAFIGAMAGIGCFAFWLATRFNNVYRRLATHELEDERRFGELRLRINDVLMQSQANAATLKHRQ